MKTNAAFKANDLTDAQVRDMLAGALKEKIKAAGDGSYSSCYVVDVNRAKGWLTYQDYGDYDGVSALYRCTFEIGDDYAVTLGEATEVVATTKYTPAPAAAFSLDMAEAIYEGETRIFPNSLLFRAGDYPDKNFGMTPAEIIAAVSAFDGNASVNLEHAPKMLVGKLGTVRKLFTDDDGQTLRGEVALPKWLDDQLTDAERQVSSEFDRGNKTFRGLALTPTPRIEGAALMAAFTAATPPVKAPPKPGTKGSRMNKLKELLAGVAAMFTKASEEVEDDGTPTDPPTPPTKVPVKPVAFDNAANEARFAAQAAELATLRADKIKMGAEKFADGEIAEFRALPRERTAMIAQFMLAAQDDHAHPGTVTFSSADGKEATGTRVDALRASQAMRPRHSYTREIISGDPEATLYFAASDDKADDSDDEEVAKNLKKTPLGKKAMDMKKGDK